ncbi:unnamed protein product [Paramecium primaurelia]|uniref:Uncharacterized protein n=1 Tax=Paramecium primaurelia TaxID=5886 RepID=A0A8S1LD15_PARPR|nr:unnamed protein product [Paramecium primaurelia]
MVEINAFKKELPKVEMDNRIKEHIKLMNDDEESKLVKAQKTIQKYEKDVEDLNQLYLKIRCYTKEKDKSIRNLNYLNQ